MTPNAHIPASPAPMPPNGDMARTHLITAAESLRVASERLCDYVEATMGETTRQDVAGQPPRGECGVVDGSGISRGAPTAPVSSPPPIPLDAVVEVEGESGLESWVWNGAEWMSGGERLHVAAVRWRALMLTALYHARRERDEARNDAAAQMMANVALANRGDDAIRERDAARDGFRLRGDTIEGLRRDLADARKARDHFRAEYHRGSVALDAICRMIETEDGYSACQTAVENVREVVNRLAVYAFEREAERDAARRELAEFRSLASDASDTRARLDAQVSINGALRAKDLQWLQLAEMGRELAAVQDQGLGATARTSREAPNSEESDCGSAVASPAPVSASLSDPAPLSGAGNTGEMGKPRRWWLVVDRDDDVATGWQEQSEADEHAEEHRRNRAFGPYTVVPVIEARVTRETVVNVAAKKWPNDSTGWINGKGAEHIAEIARALGLTVEE